MSLAAKTGSLGFECITVNWKNRGIPTIKSTYQIEYELKQIDFKNNGNLVLGFWLEFESDKHNM